LPESVEAAITYLAGLGEAGFAHHDELFGQALAERIRIGEPLTDRERRAFTRIAARYSLLLAQGGIDLTGQATEAPGGPVEQAYHGPVPIAQVVGDKIVLHRPWELRDVVEAIPGGRFNKSIGALVFTASPTTAHTLARVLDPYRLRGDGRFTDLAAKGALAGESAAHKTATDLPPVPGEVLESWLHQRQTFWWAKDLEAAGLWLPMGVGKSKIAVDLLRVNGARQALILAPKKAVRVWPKQFAIHAPDQVHVVTGLRRKRSGAWDLVSVADRTRLFDEALHECRCGRAHVVVANYELCTHEPFKAWGLEQHWDYAVADESHRIKDATGAQSKWCAQVRPKAARRLALSGTPMGQTPLDVFAQYRFLDPGVFGTSRISFEHRYAVKGGFEGREIIALRIRPRLKDGRANPYYDERVAADFDAKVFSIGHQVPEDVVDLPPIHIVEREFDLPEPVLRAYREVDKAMITLWQNEKEMSVANVLVRMLRLQQLTGGVLTPDEEEPVRIDATKREELEDVLVDIDPDEPVVVFCRFHPDLDAVRYVAERLGRPYAELSGRREDALTEDATLAIDRGVAGIQIQAGGIGVDFTKARYCVDYSVGFSRIDFVQHIKRLHRPGQTRSTTFIRLIATGTIDRLVFDVIEDMDNVVAAVMERRIAEEAA